MKAHHLLVNAHSKLILHAHVRSWTVSNGHSKAILKLAKHVMVPSLASKAALHCTALPGMPTFERLLRLWHEPYACVRPLTSMPWMYRSCRTERYRSHRNL